MVNDQKETNKKEKNVKSMQELVDANNNSLVPIKAGQMIDVEITKIGKTRIAVDVAGLNSGFIPEKEFSSDVLDLKPGDTIPAYVLLIENTDGKVVLSLKRASKERYWRILDESYKEKTPIKVRVKQANRGGLIVEFGNIEGFLPVSHLSSEHYPKVGDQKNKILEKLKRLINTSLEVKVITLEPQASKVIFSEKEAGDKILEEKIKNYKVGQKLEGTVTGIVDFGIFVDLKNIEGLVHISEISWDKVENIQKLYKPGDQVKVEIIDISNNRISLSIKRLKSDPWTKLIEGYKPKQKVMGKVTKITPYGAFVKIDDKINAMFHISEITTLKEMDIKNLNELFEIGQEYEFIINNIEEGSHKISLGWPEKPKKKIKKEPEVKEAKTKKPAVKEPKVKKTKTKKAK